MLVSRDISSRTRLRFNPNYARDYQAWLQKGVERGVYRECDYGAVGGAGVESGGGMIAPLGGKMLTVVQAGYHQWIEGFNWFAGVMTFVCLSLTSVDPAFFVAGLLMPLLTYFSTINSKAYREMQTQYHHTSFQWKDITQVAVATNREVVDIRYRYTAEGATCPSEWNFNIFCQRKQKDHVASVLKPYLLPGTPFIRAKVDVPLSTKRERRRTETEHT